MAVDILEDTGKSDLNIDLLEDVGTLGSSFDLIVCTGVLHHLVYPDAGMRALRFVLKPEGAL